MRSRRSEDMPTSSGFAVGIEPASVALGQVAPITAVAPTSTAASLDTVDMLNPP